jgi:hypothetical protein
MDALIDQAKICDFGAFIFAKDDVVEVSPTNAHEMTRANVVFEYGLFVHALGKARVLIFEEDGVLLPSDLLGIKNGRFATDDGPRQQADIETHVGDVAKGWHSLAPPAGPAASRVIDDSAFAFRRTLQNIREEVDGPCPGGSISSPACSAPSPTSAGTAGWT